VHSSFKIFHVTTGLILKLRPFRVNLKCPGVFEEKISAAIFSASKHRGEKLLE